MMKFQFLPIIPILSVKCTSGCYRKNRMWTSHHLQFSTYIIFSIFLLFLFSLFNLQLSAEYKNKMIAYEEMNKSHPNSNHHESANTGYQGHNNAFERLQKRGF